jgi:hypothetical protein
VATQIQVTIDCADPGRLARFWADALGYRLEEPPDGFASWQDYWVSRGLPPEEVEDGYDSIVDPDGVRPRIWFQPVPEPRWSRTGSISTWGSSGGRQVPLPPVAGGSTPRPSGLVAAGATRLRVLSEEAVDHYAVVMADPEGNEFCLT